MNGLIEDVWNFRPICTLSLWDPDAFRRTCIANTKRQGEIAHPMAIPTWSGIHFVVYAIVENLISNPLKYSCRILIMGIGAWWFSNVFQRSWCGTDPYAFARSSHTTYKLKRFLLACWIDSQIMVVCSIHPGTPGTPSFWIMVSMYRLDITYWVSLDAMIVKNNFPSTLSSEIGLNWVKLLESFSLGMYTPSARFHSLPTLPVSQADSTSMCRIFNTLGHLF